jgi:AcrR family transcriptional regulator
MVFVDVNIKPKLKERVVNRAVKALKQHKSLDKISLPAIALELGVSIEYLQNYYSSVEDIFLKAQKKDWESIHRYWDKQILKSRTPGDYKNAFDLFFEQFVSSLSDDADMRLEMSCYLPSCIKYREKNKKKLRDKFYKVIKRGWPGKQEKVLSRQTELITILFYGFVDHVVHVPKIERKRILRDFKNMLNLHLQDRKFF